MDALNNQGEMWVFGKDVRGNFRSLSTDKVANVVQLIISTIGSTFVTKMNKLLFYVDFIHFHRNQIIVLIKTANSVIISVFSNEKSNVEIFVLRCSFMCMSLG